MGVDRSEHDKIQRHFLRGAWRDGTLKHYNSGVVKLFRFAEVNFVNKKLLLPINQETLLQFIVWGSKKSENLAVKYESVKSTTMKSYIARIKAWHKFHGKDYPSNMDDMVALLL